MNDGVPVKILLETYSEVVREGTGDWDYDDISWHTIIQGFDVGRNEHDYDFFKPTPLKSHYYLVYVTYDTGDSFHQEYGKTCLVELLDTFEEAEVIAGAIEKDGREDRGRNNFGPLKVKMPDGQEVLVAISTWKGYFERIICVDIETVRQSRKIEL